jgi:predicted nucleic acid-binding protein
VPFVLDNSVSCGWFIETQATPYTETVAERLKSDRAVVPALWELEFTNVLRAACLRQRMNAADAQDVVADFDALPIDVDRTAVRRSELLALALRFGLTSYDAACLELALRRQLPIATLDGPLREAAIACGVGVVP